MLFGKHMWNKVISSIEKAVKSSKKEEKKTKETKKGRKKKGEELLTIENNHSNEKNQEESQQKKECNIDMNSDMNKQKKPKIEHDLIKFMNHNRMTIEDLENILKLEKFNKVDVKIRKNLNVHLVKTIEENLFY